ncbi:hypothetical protein HPP92_006846 [Vanilla planifolia]|uniref:Uncharacterized protein n=1 Tax=Vanilla planifolia TaxID=51239 RepID=A0A835VA24_VANPL|nr:hypothetical protein HPP92_006846 [Vanilla planifolia]
MEMIAAPWLNRRPAIPYDGPVKRRCLCASGEWGYEGVAPAPNRGSYYDITVIANPHARSRVTTMRHRHHALPLLLLRLTASNLAMSVPSTPCGELADHQHHVVDDARYMNLNAPWANMEKEEKE